MELSTQPNLKIFITFYSSWYFNLTGQHKDLRHDMHQIISNAHQKERIIDIYNNKNQSTSDS